jgi:sulfide:quinone oxidoreductase
LGGIGGMTMRRVVVLGAGTAGTMVVNKLRRRLERGDWQITAVDASDRHFYQPGYLFLPFGGYSPDEVVKPRQRFIADGWTWSTARWTASTRTPTPRC